MDYGSRRVFALVGPMATLITCLSISCARRDIPVPRGLRLSFKYVLNSSSDRRVVEFC